MGKTGSAVFDILTVFDTVNAIVILRLLFDSQNNLFYMVPCTDLNSICKSFNWKCFGGNLCGELTLESL